MREAGGAPGGVKGHSANSPFAALSRGRISCSLVKFALRMKTFPSQLTALLVLFYITRARLLIVPRVANTLLRKT